MWRQQLTPESRRAIVQSLAASPQAESTAFLLNLVKGQSRDIAFAAIQSLASSRFREDAKPRTAALLETLEDGRLDAAYKQKFR